MIFSLRFRSDKSPGLKNCPLRFGLTVFLVEERHKDIAHTFLKYHNNNIVQISSNFEISQNHYFYHSEFSIFLLDYFSIDSLNIGKVRLDSSQSNSQ